MKTAILRIVSVGLLLAIGAAWCEAAPSLPHLADLEAKAFLEGHDWQVKALAFSPDGKLLASADGPKGNVRLWDVASGKTVAVLDHQGAEQVVFSPDGKMLASGSRIIKLWDVAKRKHLATLEGDGPLGWMVFSPDGKKLSAMEGNPRRGEKKKLTVWSVEKQQELRSRDMPFWPILVSAYPSVKRPLLVDIYNLPRPSPSNTNYPFKLIDVFTGETVLSCEGHERHERPATSWALDREETTVASQSRLGTVRLWDRTTGRNTAVFQVRGGGIVLSPDAQILATRSTGGPGGVRGLSEAGIRLYEVPSGTLLATVKSEGTDYFLDGPFAFSTDGRVFAAAVNKNIRLWTVPAAWRKKEK